MQENAATKGQSLALACGVMESQMVGAVRFDPNSGFSAVVARRWKGLSLLGLLTVGSFEAESYFHR